MISNVIVYRSSDAGAPAFSPENINRILDACLVDGYGAGADKKPPLGYERIDDIPFVYDPDPKWSPLNGAFYQPRGPKALLGNGLWVWSRGYSSPVQYDGYKASPSYGLNLAVFLMGSELNRQTGRAKLDGASKVFSSACPNTQTAALRWPWYPSDGYEKHRGLQGAVSWLLASAPETGEFFFTLWGEGGGAYWAWYGRNQLDWDPPGGPGDFLSVCAAASNQECEAYNAWTYANALYGWPQAFCHGDGGDSSALMYENSALFFTLSSSSSSSSSSSYNYSYNGIDVSLVGVGPSALAPIIFHRQKKDVLSYRGSRYFANFPFKLAPFLSVSCGVPLDRAMAEIEVFGRPFLAWRPKTVFPGPMNITTTGIRGFLLPLDHWEV